MRNFKGLCLLVALLILVGVIGFYLSSPSYAATPQQNCTSTPGAQPNYVTHILHYAGNAGCDAQIAKIRDTFSVQQLINLTWTQVQSQANQCTNCSRLYSPSQFGTYSYQARQGDRLRLVECTSYTFYDGSSEGGCQRLGPWSM